MQPPENPYNQPPLPNPGGDPQLPFSGAPLPPQTQGVSVNILSEAWALLKLNSNWGMWIVAILISIAASSVTSIPSALLMDRTNPEAPQYTPLSVLFSFIGWVINLVVAAGMAKLAIHTVRYGRTDLAQMFDIADVIGAVLVAAILTTLATVLGFFALILPGIWIALSVSMTNFLIVDKKMSALDAIKTSWQGMQGKLLSLFLLLLVMLLVAIIPVFCTCGLAALVIGPLFQIALAIVYRNVFSPQAPATPYSGAAPYDPNNFR